MCDGLTLPVNGGIEYSSDSTAPYDVLTTATYTCDSGFALSGGDEVRTCVSNVDSTGGVWTGTAPTCEGITT